MRHGLFERCMSSHDFTRKAAESFARGIVRSNAASLVGCGITDGEAEAEVVRILPQLQRFAKEYTAFADTRYNEQKQITRTNSDSGSNGSKLTGHGIRVDINFAAHSVKATEELAVSPELGLKGNIDATVEAETTELPQNQMSGNPMGDKGPCACAPQNSLMSIELKTGHNQNPQNAHMAQLALYTLMLRVRHGSKNRLEGPCTGTGNPQLPPLHRYADSGGSNGGMLLYLNHESYHAIHVSPTLNEIKSLIAERNAVASASKRASTPRGIVLSYDRDDKSDGIPSGQGERKQRQVSYRSSAFFFFNTMGLTFFFILRAASCHL